MTTKVTDSVMDLSNVQQDIALNGKKVIGVTDVPTLDDEATSKKYVDDTIAALLTLRVPPGLGPLPWSTDTAPPGWLLCDGAIYNVSTHPELGAVLQDTYGGNGTTTFGVPDMRGRFPLGKNSPLASGSDRVVRSEALTIGDFSGLENVLLGPNNLPVHTHTGTANFGGGHTHTGSTTSSVSNHTHPYTDTNVVNGGNFIEGGDDKQLAAIGKNTGGAGGHNHTVAIPTNGSSHGHTLTINNSTPSPVSHENTPPFLTINYIIKT